MKSRPEAKCRVVVAAHRPYAMPADPVYLPLQVGAAGKPGLGYVRDDTGGNISARNANWCELTGLYWAWRNLPADFLGLVHYRRHFKGRNGIATGGEIVQALEGVDALLPRERSYFIETNYSQYAHAHHAVDLDVTRQVVAAHSPEYLPAFDEVMKLTHGHRFNMFVMRKPALDAYCSWLFDILFELERRLDISSYSSYDARVFGFVSERLLDVWVKVNGIRYRELPVLNLESQRWPVKILRFLCRKFLRAVVI